MFTSPLKRLRQSSWLDAIPEAVDVPEIGDQAARQVPIERATIDEMEFALVALDRRQSELYRLTRAMEDVLKLARKQGARGADTAISAAARDLEGGK